MLSSAERQEMVAPRRDRQALGGAAIALAVLFMGNNLPSALYGVLRAAVRIFIANPDAIRRRGGGHLARTRDFRAVIGWSLGLDDRDFGACAVRRASPPCGVGPIGGPRRTRGWTALLVAATVIRDPILTVLAMVGSGVGQCFIFVCDMSEISMATPAEERGAVIGTFYLVNYIGLCGPVIGVGMLSLSYGLLAATRVVAAVIVALCVLLIPLVVGAANASHGAAADG